MHQQHLQAPYVLRDSSAQADQVVPEHPAGPAPVRALPSDRRGRLAGISQVRSMQVTVGYDFMSVRIINQGNVYGSSRDQNFKTSDLHEAEAHEFVYSKEVAAWVRKRVVASGRFTKEANIRAAIARQLKEHHAFETERRRQTPVDYFGLKLIV